MQRIKHILVPTDFSPASWEAILYTLNLCEKHEAKMTLFHVVPGKNHNPVQVEHMSRKLQSLTNQLNKKRGNDEIAAITQAGQITQEILKHLNERSYDLVVMGVNGNGGLNKDLGTNARKIIENSPVSVRLVPNKEDQNH